MPAKRRKPGKKISSDEYARLAAFRYALRQFVRFSDATAGTGGLTGQRYQALLELRGAPGAGPVSVNDLAKRLLIRHNSAVGLADRLERQGLIMRRQSAQDARKVHLHLTAKGSRILERLAGNHREELERVGPQLGELLLQIAGAPASRRRSAPSRRKAA